MVRSAKKVENGEKIQENSETEERKRLKQLALSKKLLCKLPAKVRSPLHPAKAIIKNDGRDIVKKGHRKNKFLFAFPGLLAPISGGKIGELMDLGTKNPVLYIDFPQGRMKLFGTIVYPKNKYLTLQFSKASKNVLCEDSFENMVVFSDAWWIGKKEENPEEIQLDFPKEHNEGKHADYDFKGGVGATSEEKVSIDISVKENIEPLSPETELKADVSEDSGPLTGKNLNDMEETPVRHSTRTAGKKFNFLESSSGDDIIGSDNDADISDSDHKPEMTEEKVNDKVDNGMSENILNTSHAMPTNNIKVPKTANSNLESPSRLASQNESVKPRTPLRGQTRQASISVEKSKKDSLNKKGVLVQANLATLFEKSEAKKSTKSVKTSPAAKGSSQRRQSTSLKPKSDLAKVDRTSNKRTPTRKEKAGKQSKRARKPTKVEDEDVEEISSDSQGTDDSDEDWAG